MKCRVVACNNVIGLCMMDIDFLPCTPIVTMELESKYVPPDVEKGHIAPWIRGYRLFGAEKYRKIRCIPLVYGYDKCVCIPRTKYIWKSQWAWCTVWYVFQIFHIQEKVTRNPCHRKLFHVWVAGYYGAMKPCSDNCVLDDSSLG